MITCKDVCEKATDHLEGNLSLSQRLNLRLHLLICSACRRFYRQFKLTVGLSSRLDALPEPTDEEIEALVEKLSNKQ